MELNEQKNDFLFVDSTSKTRAHENCLYWLLQYMNKTNFMTVVFAIDGRNNFTLNIVASKLIQFGWKCEIVTTATSFEESFYGLFFSIFGWISDDKSFSCLKLVAVVLRQYKHFIAYEIDTNDVRQKKAFSKYKSSNFFFEST